MIRTLYFLLLLTLLAACDKTPPVGDLAAVPASLPALGAGGGVSVSGLSSGAYMATQYHVAYSASVSGAALFAGGPWGCAAGSLSRALSACISGADIDIAALKDRARELERAGAIDDLAHLDGDRVFLFHGSKDEVVAADLVAAAGAWYDSLGQDLKPVREFGIAAAHGLPTLASGHDCDQFEAPFINACNYDLAGETLRHLLGDLEPAAPASGELLPFAQVAPAIAGLAESGYAYVPESCRRKAGCRVHVFFHGCGQSAEQIDTVLVEQAGYNRWAESNDLVVLYPQVRPSRDEPVNPLACWDWWGYSDADYLAKGGVQLDAIQQMVAALQRRP